MKKTLLSISLLFSLSVLGLQAQAQYVIKLADEQYNLYNYSKAVELYQQAYKKKPTLHAAENLANSYRLMRDYKNAETWYATTIATPGSSPENIYKYAEVLKNMLKYSEAKKQYTRYYTLRIPVDTVQLRYWTTSCDSAMKWMKYPAPVNVANVQALNSAQSDWGAVTYNNALVFTSDRGKLNDDSIEKKNKPFLRFDFEDKYNKHVYGWTGNKYLRLYESGTDVKLADAVKLFPFSAETDYHVGAASFTADGNEMYFTLTRIPAKWAKRQDSVRTVNIEIYTSQKDPSTQRWKQPVAFKYNNAESWSVGDPFITSDGKILYFVSDMPGGMGGTDIYYCEKDANGNWSDPVNLKGVNTKGNERTPVIDRDNAIYFSTDGNKGMGGLDVFKAVRKGSGYQKQNMGYPINSPQDDFAFIMVNSTDGYLSSNRTGGVGSDDIYSFVQKPAPTYQLAGVVYDKSTHVPLSNSAVTLTQIKGRDVKVVTNAGGAFSFTLNDKNEYRLKGEKEGYLSDNRGQVISTTGLNPSEVVKKDLYLEKIVLKKAIRLENIYYDLNKSDIRPDAAIELDKLIKILKDNPTIVIELGSHTDSRGNDDYNKALSERRANAAVDYIINVGHIEENRIIARGYGETRLLNRCGNGVKCTDAEHQLNRRTEFMIIRY